MNRKWNLLSSNSFQQSLGSGLVWYGFGYLVCTSSRAADWGLARLAVADSEGAGADGLAVTSFFLSLRGLSRESSTVASVREEKEVKKPDVGHLIPYGNMCRCALFITPPWPPYKSDSMNSHLHTIIYIIQLNASGRFYTYLKIISFAGFFKSLIKIILNCFFTLQFWLEKVQLYNKGRKCHSFPHRISGAQSAGPMGSWLPLLPQSL